jgi:hypothetical protein
MKIVTFDSARVTWLFPLEEFAPSSGANPPAILAEIAERYGFKKMPQITTREDMAKNGLPFGVGQFDVDNTTVMISDFAIYNDGLVAAAERTEWAEAFLNDAYNCVRSDAHGEPYRSADRNRKIGCRSLASTDGSPRESRP